MIPDLVMSEGFWLGLEINCVHKLSSPRSGSILATPGIALASDNDKFQIAHVLADLIDVW